MTLNQSLHIHISKRIFKVNIEVIEICKVWVYLNMHSVDLNLDKR